MLSLSLGQIHRIAELAIEGLQTDGAHHKQWFLKEIAVVLGLDLSQLDVEEGVKP